MFAPRPVLTSLFLGWAGFLLAPLSIAISLETFTLNIVWSFVFPLMAGLAYGPGYALIAAFPGLGALFPFILWADNGWALPGVVAAYAAWMWLQGAWARGRRLKPELWNHPLAAQGLSTAVYVLLVGLGYPLLFSFNPPPWNPSAPSSIAPEILWRIVFKDTVTMAFVLIVAQQLLRVNPLRRLLGLAADFRFRHNGRIYLMTVLGFGLIWGLQTLFDHLLFGFPELTPSEILGAFVLALASAPAGLILGIYAEHRLRAEKDLLTEERRYRDTLEFLPLPVGVINSAGQILSLNRAFSEAFGYTRTEIPDLQAWMEQAYPDPALREAGRRLWEADVARALSRGEATPFREYRLVARDLRERRVLIGTRPLGQEYLTVFHDVTERFRLLEASQNNQRLESLGLLAGGLAHDFNNLLAGIYGHLELIALDEPPPEMRARLEAVLGLIDRSRGLTQQLLTFAKGGQPRLERRELGPVLRAAAEFAAAGSPVRLETSGLNAPWTAAFDPAQLSQVVDNLVINARQALEGRGGVIRVSMGQEPLAEGHPSGLPPGLYLWACVEDDGPGLPPGRLDQVFDPFFTTKPTGQGLGLAVSFSILRKHGGLLEAENRPEGGARFRFYLPAADPQAAPVPGTCPEPRPARGVTAQGSALQVRPGAAPGRSLLILDDEPELRDVLCAMTASLGFEPEAFGEGDAAAAAFRSRLNGPRAFAAALLDLTLPGGLGGLETARQLRAADPRVRLYLISGYADDPVLACPEAEGFDGALRKPFQLEELKSLLSAILPA